MKNLSFMTCLYSKNHRRLVVSLMVVVFTLASAPALHSAWATERLSLKASGSSVNLSASEKKEVPFKGSYATRILPFDTSTFPNFQMEIELIGRASHLGNITGTISQYTSYNPPDYNTGTISGPTFFVASNGDKLYSTFTGTFSQDAAGKATFSGEYTFNGGTGRFVEATGSAIAIGSADVNAGIGFVEFSGTLSY